MAEAALGWAAARPNHKKGAIHMDEIQKLKAQRDGLARYIFEQNDGALYVSHCRHHMEAGDCPYHNQPSDTERAAGMCVPCILELIGDGAAKPPDPFFLLLAEYHVLVTYFVLGGTMGTGRVQTVQDGNITIMAGNEPQLYALKDIDVIVPREVLRWSNGELSPATWWTEPAERMAQELPPNVFGTIAAGLQNIGIQPLMEGAAELEIAIWLVLENPTYLERLLDNLYPAVADETGETVSMVTHRICRVIELAKQNSRSTGNGSNFYSAIIGRRANVKAFLRAFTQYMKREGFCGTCLNN